MNCGQKATVAVCAFTPTDPPGQTPRKAACGVSPHCSCGPKRGTLPWPLSFPKTKSQMPWHSQLMGKARQPAFVHCHGSSAHAAATLLPRRGSTCNSPSPCNWLLTCHWRTCIFSGPALCHFFRPPRGEVQRVYCPGRPAAACWQPSRCSWGTPSRCPPSGLNFRIVLPHARLQFSYPDMSYMPICLLSNAYFVYNAYCGPTLRCLPCLTTCIRLGVGRLQSWIEHQHPLYQCGHLHWSKTV